MKLNQVAIQLYTLRDFCSTPQDFIATVKKVRQIGFQNVELAGAPAIPEEEIIHILQGEGLTCCSSHESPATILTSPQKVVDRISKLGCKYAVYPYPSEINLKSESDIHRFAKNLDLSGALLHQAGLTLCYHNHAHEFEKHGSKTIMDILYEESKPENLQAELDTYWVQMGGCNPAQWCKQMNNRLPLLHLKDFGINPENHQPVFKEIGSGNLDFKSIIAAAEASGCQWFIVEQDVCPGDPFVSIQKSFEYLKTSLATE